MNMDETTFEYDSDHLADMSRRFPARRRPHRAPRPQHDMAYLRTARGAEFGRHAWDEGGHL